MPSWNVPGPWLLWNGCFKTTKVLWNFLKFYTHKIEHCVQGRWWGVHRLPSEAKPGRLWKWEERGGGGEGRNQGSKTLMMMMRKIWRTTSGLCLLCRVVPPQEGDRQASDHQHRCDFLPGRAFSQQKEERHILGPWWRSLQFYMLSPEGWRRSNTHLLQYYYNTYYLELTTDRTVRTKHDLHLNLNFSKWPK